MYFVALSFFTLTIKVLVRVQKIRVNIIDQLWQAIVVLVGQNGGDDGQDGQPSPRGTQTVENILHRPAAQSLQLRTREFTHLSIKTT